MSKRKVNIGEVFGGIGIVVTMWILCILSGGTLAMGDVLEFWEGSVILSTASIFAYIAICVLIGIYSKRNGHRSFFMSVTITSLLPFVAIALMYIFSTIEMPLSKRYVALMGNESAERTAIKAVLTAIEFPIVISYPFLLVIYSMAYAFGGESGFGIIMGFVLFSLAPIGSILAYKFTKIKK